MSKNINQIYIANPAVSMIASDLFYLGRSPYNSASDMAITWDDVISSINKVGTITTGVWQGSVIGLSYGGTGKVIVPSTGGIVWTDSDSLEVLPGTATARRMFQSGALAAPSWSTATWPTTTTVNGILYSSSNNVVGQILTGNNGVLITSPGGIPSISSILPSVVQDNITRLGTIVNIGTPLGVAFGGTGIANPTAYTIPIAQGASPYSFVGPLSNGQLLIGATGADPIPAALTAGANISITTGAGSISISSTGNMTTVEATGVTQTIAVNTRYIANNGAGVAFALPATSAIGDVFSIVGKSGVWSITQGAGQQLLVGMGSTTLGGAGSLTAADQTDSVKFVCITANTIWQVEGGPQTAGFIMA